MKTHGIHRRIAESGYRAFPALSPSGASRLLRSPAHYRAYIDTPSADTPALRVGRATHTLVLEGRRAFDDRYAVAPECDGRTREGKATMAEFRGRNGTREVLTANEAAQVEAMAAAVDAHPLIPALLTDAEPEVSLRWRDPETGAECKGRPDALRLAAGVLIDLKTTLDASPGAFARSVLNYGYHTQAAAYAGALRGLGCDVRDYVIICVEKAAPFACAVYRLSDAALELGAKRWHEACAIYAECTKRNKWPGYSADLQELALPAWAMSEFYQSEVEEQ